MAPAEPSSRLEADGLQKSFGARKVVKDIHLAVGAGEVIGLLGPNGAGKTTTFYMVVGLIRSDAGEIRIGIVSGREVSANFDMHNLASLLVGDQVRVRRSAHKVRFLHPRGWSYYATLRRKLRWYEGVV